MRNYQRLFWTQRIIVLAIGIGILMSLPLWVTERQFPLIPVIPGTLPLTQLGSQIALLLLSLSLLASFIWTKTRILVFITAALLLTIGLQDFNRLQPWYWQYTLILIILIPLAKGYKKYLDINHLLFAAQLTVSAVYFFSALFKFNESFFFRIVRYMYQPITNYLVTWREQIFLTGYAIPPLEMSIALLLFIPRLRIFGILLATGMHLAALILLGPFGLNANSVVWPWNIALIALIWVLFYKADNYKYNIYLSRLNWSAYAVLIAVWILPFLNLKGWYNESLSFELYSGRSYTPHMRYHQSEIDFVPKYMEPYTFKKGDTVFVNTYNWSMQQFNVPPNSDWKVIRQVQEKSLKKFQNR